MGLARADYDGGYRTNNGMGFDSEEDAARAAAVELREASDDPITYGDANNADGGYYEYAASILESNGMYFYTVPNTSMNPVQVPIYNYGEGTTWNGELAASVAGIHSHIQPEHLPFGTNDPNRLSATDRVYSINSNGERTAYLAAPNGEIWAFNSNWTNDREI